VAVTDAGRGREVLEAEDFPLRDLIALAHETSATPWFCVSKNQLLENCRGSVSIAASSLAD
jgi:hypothetical protein